VTDRMRDPGPPPARGHYTEQGRLERLRWAREHTGAALESLEHQGLDAGELAGNVENLVGSVEVPVGLAGPLLFRGDRAQGYISAPLATTEGALVASASRGARAISRAGGVATQLLRQRMVRAPFYEFADISAALRFGRWAEARVDELRERVAEVSDHAKLVAVEPLQLGRTVHLRLVFETGDAAGQNMTTACTWHACRWINRELAQEGLVVEGFQIDGNTSGDKKLSQLNLLGTRGSRVTAECWIDAATLREVLKVSRDELVESYRRGLLGGIQAGAVGGHVNVSNIVAGIFAATGQDIACVHESGSGVLTIEPDGDGVYAAMLLPALVVGTVGGGTGLPRQHDYLELLGCAGDGGAARLAEIVAGFALALDLSTCAAIGGGQFADAHERLGRNRPVDWFTASDLTPELLRPLVSEALDRPELELHGVVRSDDELGAGIVSELTAQTATQKLVGVLPLRLDLGVDGELDVVVKSKPLDDEVILATNRVASLCGGSVAETHSRWRDWTGFKGSHERELALFGSPSEGLARVLPRVYGVHSDPDREAYLIVMERLRSDVILKDSADDVRGWRSEHVDAALAGIAGVHADWLGREDELTAQPWLGPVLDPERVAELRELWSAIAAHAADEYPRWVDELALLEISRAIETLPGWWREFERMPRTLVHGDFNPRNIALRRDGLQLVAWDWELATLHVPQRDLAELLAFVLTPDADPARVDHHVEIHRRALERAASVELDREQWRRGYRLALHEFAITRLGLYLMGHTQHSYDFLDRVVSTVKRLVEIEDGGSPSSGGPMHRSLFERAAKRR
jgi:hydroxymethylglutaryl-CoA reductase (NADPH)